MNKYVYPGTRAKTLANDLLTGTQLEVLLSSKDTKDSFRALQDTFLASHLEKGESDLLPAIERSLLSAKEVLNLISPDKEFLDIVWLKYDFFNLKTIIKGKIKGLKEEEIKDQTSNLGRYSVEDLIDAYNKNKLKNLDLYLDKASEEAKKQEEIYNLDMVIDKHYFLAISFLASKTRNRFVKDYVSLLIDLFNLSSRLRAERLRGQGGEPKDIFIKGGSFSEKDLADEKGVLEKLNKLGSPKRWSEVIERYRKDGDFGFLEKTMEDYKMEFLRERSLYIFSPAPLFFYFSAMVNDSSIIKAIVSAKSVGLLESDIRASLRKTTYV